MNTFYKINHWTLVLAFLALACTALAADFFFSKEAIMKSFEISTPQLNLTIAPADQLFMARIARRVTWDWHLYSGILFFTSIMLISFKYRRFKDYKSLLGASIIVMIITGIVLFISGLLMFLRLYDPITEDFFQLLKVFHNYGKWIFMGTIVVHIYAVVQKNSTNENYNTLNNMFKK